MGVPCCRDRRHYTINQILGLRMRMISRTAPSSGALRTGSMALEARLWQSLDQLYAK